MPQSKYFRIGLGILLTFLIIWVGTKISFIFYPFIVLFQTLFAPVLISGALYYISRPWVHFLVRRKVPKLLAILSVYLIGTGLMVVIVIFIAPILQRQFSELVTNMPKLLQTMVNETMKFAENEWVREALESFDIDLNQAPTYVSEYLMSALRLLSNNLRNVIDIIVNIFLLVVIVPLILFYLLKDEGKFSAGLLKLLPRNKQAAGRTILNKMDETISLYIRGQIIVAFCIGVMLWIGYMMIGIEYASLLALAAMVTNMIPYLGPILASIPAVAVAIVDSPFMVVKVLLVMIISQQIEGNLISPQIMGRRLEIHPLTIIFLLLVVGSLFGVLGMLLAVPTYAVVKILVVHLYGLLRLRYDPPTSEINDE